MVFEIDDDTDTHTQLGRWHYQDTVNDRIARAYKQQRTAVWQAHYKCSECGELLALSSAYQGCRLNPPEDADDLYLFKGFFNHKGCNNWAVVCWFQLVDH